jgi:hypothetical protein
MEPVLEPVLTVSPAPCRLVGGAFAVVVQALLCVVAFVALFFKRNCTKILVHFPYIR